MVVAHLRVQGQDPAAGWVGHWCPPQKIAVAPPGAEQSLDEEDGDGSHGCS